MAMSASKTSKKKPVKKPIRKAAPAVDAPVEATGPGYVIVNDVEQASKTPPVEEPVADAAPAKAWFSGYCGVGPDCNDEHHISKVGEVLRHCLYVAENGSKAARRYMYCACSCHTDPNRAGQAVARD